MVKSKKITKNGWLVIAVLMVLIILMGSIFIKLVSNEINSYLVAAIRYGLVGIITIPFIIHAIRQHGKLMLEKLPIILAVTL